MSNKAIDTRIKIGKTEFANPVIAASGCYGFGREFAGYTDISRLGGISVKGLTLLPRDGNPSPRIAETPSGILNSVGLQNPGVEAFIRDELPFLRKTGTKVIANAAGAEISEYARMAEILDGAGTDALELNLSCPNVKAGCAAFGSRPDTLREAVREARRHYRGTLIVKLTPNVTDITELARAAEDEGADALSLINTLLGMAIDAKTRRPVLANITGGLSGPCVKPVALRMVWQVHAAVRIPIIGMGGIENGTDAAEFMMAGASAVMVGSANLVRPTAAVDVLDGLISFAENAGETRLADITGTLRI